MTKYHPTWPQIFLLVVIFTAIIVSHLFAPMAVSVVTSIASTLIGVFFVNIKHEEVKSK